MIEGQVNFNREPLTRLTLLGADGEEAEIEALADTGFNGSLTLSQTMIEKLGWLPVSSAMATLADGNSHRLATYRGMRRWEGVARPITVIAANGIPLAGMSL